MIDIERFIEARKKLGLSQVELAQGICTQTTLSRFENEGKIPNLKIVIQLCKRLNLAIGELFPKIGIQNSQENEWMNQAEFLLITSEFAQAQQLISKITATHLVEPAVRLRYFYIKGFLAIFQEDSFSTVLFTFNQILMDEHLAQYPLFRLLAYAGLGRGYVQEAHLLEASTYYEKILAEIYEYPVETTEDIWRVLHLLFECGVFYSQMGELAIGNALLEQAIKVCSDNHVTYYLARVAYQLARNAQQEKQDPFVILEKIQDAKAFSKINDNRLLLAKLGEFEAEIKRLVEESEQR